MKTIQCPKCQGKGRMVPERIKGRINFNDTVVDCAMCETAGVLDHGLYICPTCWEDEPLTVTPEALAEAADFDLNCPWCNESFKEFAPMAPEDIPHKDKWADRVMDIGSIHDHNRSRETGD